MAMTCVCKVVLISAMFHGVASDDARELAVAYNTTLEPSPCATAGPVPTPAPASPCGTVAPVITTTTTPASPCGTVAPVITTTTTPASPCGTVAPATTVTTTPAAASPCGTVAPVATIAPAPCGTVAPVATVTTTPAATFTTTPAATITTTPAGTFTTTPAATITTTPAGTVAPASPCGTVAPAAKFAMEQAGEEKKSQSLLQRMADTPITVGLFGLLLASVVVGMVVRATRRRSNRLTFTGRTITTDEGDYNDVPASDIEQAFLE